MGLQGFSDGCSSRGFQMLPGAGAYGWLQQDPGQFSYCEMLGLMYEDAMLFVTYLMK